jgi:hypothetical protein
MLVSDADVRFESGFWGRPNHLSIRRVQTPTLGQSYGLDPTNTTQSRSRSLNSDLEMPEVPQPLGECDTSHGRTSDLANTVDEPLRLSPPPLRLT